MSKAFARNDFLIKDLVVSIGAGGRAGSWLPGPDDETPPPTISPIASVFANVGLIEAVRLTINDAVEAKRFDDIARAFAQGEAGGSPVIRQAIHEIGSAVVASAAFAALSLSGLPADDGTVVPSPWTPIADVGFKMHRVTELPRLRKQLAEAVAFVEMAAAAQAPRGGEVAVVRAQLEGALKNLPQAESAEAAAAGR